MEDIPDYGDHMSLSDFAQCCAYESFIDYDGSGYYATENKIFRNEEAIPSEIVSGNIDTNFTHVVWFNK